MFFSGSAVIDEHNNSGFGKKGKAPWIAMYTSYVSVVTEVSSPAEEAWAMQIMMRATFYAAMVTCTPSYNTNEGEALAQESGCWEDGNLRCCFACCLVA